MKFRKKNVKITKSLSVIGFLRGLQTRQNHVLYVKINEYYHTISHIIILSLMLYAPISILSLAIQCQRQTLSNLTYRERRLFGSSGTHRLIQFINLYFFRPLSPIWRISAFEKRLLETERSLNNVDCVKRSGRSCSIIDCSWNICQISRTLTIRKSLCHVFFSNFTIFRL